MAYLALFDLFEYLCYGSMTIRNIFTLPARGSTLVVRDRLSDVYRRQILTSKVDPLAVRVKPNKRHRNYVFFLL